MPTGADGRPRAGLGRGGRRERRLEPGPGGGAELVEHVSHTAATVRRNSHAALAPLVKYRVRSRHTTGDLSITVREEQCDERLRAPAPAARRASGRSPRGREPGRP